jgi:hypothetical protein
MTQCFEKAYLEDTAGELAIPSTSGQQQLPIQEDSADSSTDPESIDGDCKPNLKALEEKVKKIHQEYRYESTIDTNSNRDVFHQDGAIPHNTRMNVVFLDHLNHFGER